MDSENLNGMQAFFTEGHVAFVGIGTNSRMIFRTVGSNVGFTNITIENNNHVLIEGQAGQGIDILNNQIAMNGTTTFNNSINVNNNTITLTDGTITSTLNKSDWTGTIKTVNTTANATHF